MKIHQTEFSRQALQHHAHFKVTYLNLLLIDIFPSLLWIIGLCSYPRYGRTGLYTQGQL